MTTENKQSDWSTVREVLLDYDANKYPHKFIGHYSLEAFGRLEAQAAAVKTAIPETFYASLPIEQRVGFMANQWNRAISVNQDLEAQAESREKRIAELEAVAPECHNCANPPHDGPCKRKLPDSTGQTPLTHALSECEYWDAFEKRIKHRVPAQVTLDYQMKASGHPDAIPHDLSCPSDALRTRAESAESALADAVAANKRLAAIAEAAKKLCGILPAINHEFWVKSSALRKALEAK